MSYAEAAARAPPPVVPRGEPPVRVLEADAKHPVIPKELWVCFFTDADEGRRTLNFHGHLSPHEGTRMLMVKEEVESFQIKQDHYGYDLTITFKRRSEEFSELCKFWKDQVGARRDDPGLHGIFYDRFVEKFT